MIFADFVAFYDGEKPELIDHLFKHVFEEVDSLMDILPDDINVSLSGTESGYLRYFVSSKYCNLMFTVEFEGLFSFNRELSLSIELAREALVDKELYKTIEYSNAELNSGILLDSFYFNRNRIFAKYATIDLHPSAEDIYYLSDYILKILTKKQFLSIFKKIEAKLTE